ncbi:hypothetical protein CHU95_01730 [Niveispirillum lacus]|uniref:Uncharacterized protein n=1 Tax=Niveispirillum lacus TaxID=1981099 RepID=A0A255Z748_9PROT|nr:hypothetical protein CHU95_01730 [Niveispirillum lacus]
MGYGLAKVTAAGAFRSPRRPIPALLAHQPFFMSMAWVGDEDETHGCLGRPGGGTDDNGTGG